MIKLNFKTVIYLENSFIGNKIIKFYLYKDYLIIFYINYN